MKILLVSDHEYLPDRVGGRESSTHELATRLSRKGHEVIVLCRDWRPRRALVRRQLVGPLWAAGTRLRRLVYRFRSEYRILRLRRTDRGYFANALKSLTPDICVFQVHRPLIYIETARTSGVPHIVFVRDFENAEHIADCRTAGSANIIANSKFIAECCSRLFNREIPYCYPIIEPSRYRAEKENSGNAVLFINPVPEKGLNIALAVARLCPEIPFIFLEGWPMEPARKSALLRDLTRIPNIRWHDATQDMKEPYRLARLLIAPSQWSEAFGRVIVEAQINGIPAIASNIGGLPEAVGEGGILLAPDGQVELWAEAIRKLWIDETEYSRIRDKALSMASRKTLSPEYLTDRLEQLLLEALREPK